MEIFCENKVEVLFGLIFFVSNCYLIRLKPFLKVEVLEISLF